MVIAMPTTPPSATETVVKLSKDTRSTDDIQSTRPTRNADARALQQQLGALVTTEPKRNAGQDTEKDRKGKRKCSAMSKLVSWDPSTLPAEADQPMTSVKIAALTSDQGDMLVGEPCLSVMSSPQTEGANDIDNVPMMAALVGNLRDIASHFTAKGPSQAALDDIQDPRLPCPTAVGAEAPLSRTTTRESAPSSAAANERPPERGMDVLTYTLATTAGSMILLVILYFLKGFRAHALACGGYNCSSSSAATYPPNI